TATAADGNITISVRDTGIGIAPEDQAAIFEEFRQVGRDDARKQEGTGLGLTLAKKFVELHGGRIGVRSQVGQGTGGQLYACPGCHQPFVANGRQEYCTKTCSQQVRTARWREADAARDYERSRRQGSAKERPGA